MGWDDPGADPLGDMHAELERMRCDPRTVERDGVLIVSQRLIDVYGLEAVQGEADQIARAWGFRSAIVRTDGGA